MADIKEAIKKSTKYAQPGKKPGESLTSYILTYDSASSALEPVYFWLLDFLAPFTSEPIEKVTDNFASSPGSGHFGELGQRATRMQEEGMKVLGLMNQVIKTMINLLYDLKEFEMRLGHYEDAKSKDKAKKEAANLALKQIWLDQVDIKKGNTSVKAMAFSQAPFATLIDAFMIVDDEKLKDANGEKLDLNDRVKRVLEQRILEYNRWKVLSEDELRKRYNIERAYLRTEVESLKMYTSWARPYLKAAEELRMKGFDKNPALVSAFNTTMFELVLFGKSKYIFEKAAMAKELPYGLQGYTKKRDYFSCWVITLVFRGFPQRIDQRGDYSFGGRVDMNFDCYVLNDEELQLVKKNMEKQDMESTFKLLESTNESLDQMKADLDHFLDNKKDEKKEVKDLSANPFSALFDVFKIKKDKKDEKKEVKDLDQIKKDNFVEKMIREKSAESAKGALYTIYDVYKKAHGMASSPEAFGEKMNPINKRAGV